MSYESNDAAASELSSFLVDLTAINPFIDQYDEHGYVRFQC